MRRLVLAAVVFLGAVACAAEPGDEGSGNGGSCPVGSAACPCTTGGGCDPGLDCRSDVCVDLSGGGSGGTGGPCSLGQACDSDAGEVCDQAEGECQVPCSVDADCSDQRCCADGDVPACEDACDVACTYFPDTCPAGLQCYMDAADSTATLCSGPGAKALGDDCDNTAGTKAQYCGREMACVQYGDGPNLVNRCTQLCTVDADCAATLVSCTPLSMPGLAICPLP